MNVIPQLRGGLVYHGEHGSLRSSLAASKTVHVHVNDYVNVHVDVNVNGSRHALLAV